MTDDDRKPYEIGLYISRHRNTYDNGAIVITVSVVRKSDDGESIRNVFSGNWDWGQRAPVRVRKFEFANLGMGGQVYHSNTGAKELIAFEPRYRDVFSVELPEAERMLKTLKALNRAIDRRRKADDVPMSPAGMLSVFARFVGAKFIVYRDDAAHGIGGRSYDAVEWNFSSVRDGIATYADEVSKWCAEHKKNAA